MIRLVVCFDFDTDDPQEAYSMLRTEIPELSSHEHLGWHTSNKWYLNDEPGDPDVLNDAVCEWMNETYGHN